MCCRKVRALSESTSGACRHCYRAPMLFHVTHNTTPSEQQSGSGATEPVNEHGYPLFERSDVPSRIAESVAEVAELGTHLVQLDLGRYGRRPLHDVRAALLPDHDPAFLLQQPDCCLRRVERDAVLCHQRSVRGQARTEGVGPGVDLRPKQLCDAMTRRSAVCVIYLVIHAAKRTASVLRQRLTATTGQGYCPATDRLYETLIEEEYMAGASYAVDPDEPSPDELAAMAADLPEHQRRAVWDYWESVLAECRAKVRDAPPPTSALLDGSAAERRYRRMERRALAAVVRELPVRMGSSRYGREAA